MNAISQTARAPAGNARTRKPRVALMGEFSAGKSTLMNLLLGFDPLPVQITATRVPPVWVTYGQQAVVRVLTDGTEECLSLEDLAETPLDGTRVIRVSLESEILELCDLFDIPGISDPNMSHETWADLVDEIDSVIWCTHATQAWRQSEAAIWEEIADRTRGGNMLVVTQFDKLRSERDQARVLARLHKEAGDKFDAIFPLATLQALEAGVDEDVWNKSGGADFVEHLVAALLMVRVEQDPDFAETDLVTETDLDAALFSTEPFDRIERDLAREEDPGPDLRVQPEAVDHADAERIIPRRIRPKAGTSSRPSPEDSPYHGVDLNELRGDDVEHAARETG